MSPFMENFRDEAERAHQRHSPGGGGWTPPTTPASPSHYGTGTGSGGAGTPATTAPPGPFVTDGTGILDNLPVVEIILVALVLAVGFWVYRKYLDPARFHPGHLERVRSSLRAEWEEVGLQKPEVKAISPAVISTYAARSDVPSLGVVGARLSIVCGTNVQITQSGNTFYIRPKALGS